MSGRDRIGRMEPDNQPAAGRSRRRPPDDEPTPQPDLPQQPEAPTEPAAALGRDLEPVSDSASGLYSLLAGSDTQQGEGPGDGGRDAIIDALTAPPPPPDPDLELVTLGVRIPQYLGTALRTMAFLRHRRQQELVREALQQYVPAELLAECRAAAERERRAS